MSKINLFDLDIGNYCTAYEIGAKVKEITGDSKFFKRKNSDGQERIGRWVNAEAGTIYKNDVTYALDGMDVISLPIEENKVTLEVWAAQGLINERWYIRHGKLDLYSERISEMIIRSFTGKLDYEIADDVNIIFEYRYAPIEWVHNDLSSKYVHRERNKLKGHTRKALLRNTITRSERLSKIRSEAEYMVESIDNDRKPRGEDILVYFPADAVKLLRFYWRLSKARIWYRNQLLSVPHMPKDIEAEVSHFTREMVDKFFNK